LSNNVNVNFIAGHYFRNLKVFFFFAFHSQNPLAEERRSMQRLRYLYVTLRKSRPSASLSSSRVCATRWRLNAKEGSWENGERDEKSGIAERAGKGKILRVRERAQGGSGKEKKRSAYIGADRRRRHKRRIHAYTYTHMYTKGRISFGVTTIRSTPDRLPLAKDSRTIKLSHDPHVKRNK